MQTLQNVSVRVVSDCLFETSWSAIWCESSTNTWLLLATNIDISITSSMVLPWFLGGTRECQAVSVFMLAESVCISSLFCCREISAKVMRDSTTVCAALRRKISFWSTAAMWALSHCIHERFESASVCLRSATYPARTSLLLVPVYRCALNAMLSVEFYHRLSFN